MRTRGHLGRYLTTAFCARLADEGMAVVVVLLALRRTGSAADGAFLLTAWMAPHVLAAPLAGSLAARVPRPRLFRVCALGGFAAAIAGLTLTLGRAPVGVTLAIALTGGACGPVVSGGLSSLVAVLVPAGEERARAYAWDAATYNAASVAGPAAVAVTAMALSPGAAAFLLAGAAALAAVLAVSLPPERTATGAAPGEARGTGTEGAADPGPVGQGPADADTTRAPGARTPGARTPGGCRDATRTPGACTTGADGPRQTLRADLAAALRVVRRTRELRAVTAATSLAFVGVGGLTTSAVLLAEDRGHPGGGGLLVTLFAIGALAGSLGLARWRPHLPAHRLVAASLLGTGLALGAAALLPSFTAAAALFAVAGLCDGPLLSATLRIRADHAPPHLRTQVFTLGAGLKISAAACGAALTGAAAAWSPSLLLVAIALVHLAALLLYCLARSVPAGRTARPDTPPVHRSPRPTPSRHADGGTS
ncbi:MFS transporter [Streptomyces sp. NPDC047108]|uniref:MFS transporter n=1 Tax=Streptomyces sp. NPDC047108 TaxID=3155025 RepID=UPI0033D4A7E8